MRLFVAIVPPAEVLDHLAAAVTVLRAEGPPADDPALRWSRREAWHLTLAFLGEVAEGRLEELDRRLGRAGARHPPATLQLERAGRFDGRVLWAGVGGDRPVVSRLAASVGAAARRTRIEVDDRRLRPHVTLARAREPVDLRPLVGALDDYTGPSWTATEFALIRSRLGAGPDRTAAYDVRATYPLAG